MEKVNDVHIRARRNFSRISRYVSENISPESSEVWESGGKVGGRQPMWLFKRNKFNTAFCKFPAVYIFLSNEGDILYIGKAKDVSDRVEKHLGYTSDQNVFMDYVGNIVLIKFRSRHDGKLAELESELISEFKPIFNTTGNDGLINFSLIKRNIISKYPSHKDAVVRNVILRHRELTEGYNCTKELTKYSEHVSVEAVLGELSIFEGEYDRTPDKYREGEII